MTGSAADIWLLSYSRGLLRSADGRLIEEYPWPRLQHRPQASVIAVDRQRGGLWLGFWLEGGVAYFKDGKVQASYTSADGLGKGRNRGRPQRFSAWTRHYVDQQKRAPL
jgi:hypothetical protein